MHPLTFIWPSKRNWIVKTQGEEKYLISLATSILKMLAPRRSLSSAISPEEAHRMFVASTSRGLTEFFEFVSQPCGPRKLARAMNMCIKRQRDRESGRRSSDEPTHWIEVPQSSHLPVDIEASDPPEDRMRISKRPTADTMGTQEDRSFQSLYQEHPQADQERTSWTSPRSKDEVIPEIQKPSVLLVDDNDVNLQLLCAYAQKDGFEYKSAKDGAQAVDIYKAHPGLFKIIIIGMSLHHPRFSLSSPLASAISATLLVLSFSYFDTDG